MGYFPHSLICPGERQKNREITMVPMLRGYLVSGTCKHNSNCYTNGNNRLLTSPGVVVTPEINMANKTVWQVLIASQRCKTVIVCFGACGIYYRNTVRIFCKSIFQDGDHKPEVPSVLHITFTVFACRRSQIQYGCGAFPPPS